MDSSNSLWTLYHLTAISPIASLVVEFRMSSMHVFVLHFSSVLQYSCLCFFVGGKLNISLFCCSFFRDSLNMNSHRSEWREDVKVILCCFIGQSLMGTQWPVILCARNLCLYVWSYAPEKQ